LRPTVDCVVTVVDVTVCNGNAVYRFCRCIRRYAYDGDGGEDGQVRYAMGVGTRVD